MGSLRWKVVVVLTCLAGVVSTDHAFDRHAVSDQRQQPRPVMVRVDDEIAAEDCTHFHSRLEVSAQFAENNFFWLRSSHRVPLQVESHLFEWKDVESCALRMRRQNVNFPLPTEYFRFIRSSQ